MPRQELDEALAQLHRELAEAELLDQDQIDSLQAMVAEIQTTLDKVDANDASLAGRMREAAQQFEQSHPTLTNTVGRVADMLAQMGI